MQLLIRNIQYHPHTGAVALLVEDPFGGQGFLNTTEDVLHPRGGNWGNDEVLAEAQRIVDDASSEWRLARPSMADVPLTVVFAPAPDAPVEATPVAPAARSVTAARKTVRRKGKA